MFLAVIGEGSLQAARVFVVMVNAALLGMPAARIEPDFRIPGDSVHAARFERVEEYNSIDCNAYLSHGECCDSVGRFWHEWNLEVEILCADRVGIAAVGEPGVWVIGQILRIDDQELFIVADAQVGNAIFVRVPDLVREEIDISSGIPVKVDVRLPSLHIPATAYWLEPLGYFRGRIFLSIAESRFCSRIRCLSTTSTWAAGSARTGTPWSAARATWWT